MAVKTPVATMPQLQAEPILHPPQPHTVALRPPVSQCLLLEPGLTVPRRQEHSTPLPQAAHPRSRTTPLHPLPGIVVHMTLPHQRWAETATMRDHGTKKERLVLNIIYCGA